ncbi:MAG: hypothetical protein NVS9B7_03720 [Flavisolibacter sp.]
MKKVVNFIDYGIYIDHNHSYIISVNNSRNQLLIENEIQEIKSGNTSDNSAHNPHAQNHSNELVKKFCKAIISKIVHVNKILIFGPSETKFELQKEIHLSKNLKDIKEDLAVTDKMQSEEALRYVKNYYI